MSTAELITTQLVTLLMIVDWRLSYVAVAAFWGPFSLIDASFLSANLVKVRREAECVAQAWPPGGGEGAPWPLLWLKRIL